MRTGKELILATKEYVKEDKAKSWFHIVVTLIMMGGFLTLTTLPINIFIRIGASIFAGFSIVRMFIIYHDFLHKNILHKNLLATIIMKTYGILVLTPPSIWKRTHDYHHKHNSKLFSASVGSYPVMTKNKFLQATPREKFEYLAVRHPLTILFGYITMFVYGMCIQSFMADRKKHWDALIALSLHAVFIGLALYLSGWVTLVLAILLPSFVSSAIGSYLFYAQHNFPGAIYNSNEDWNYLDAALGSSSYMVMPPVVQWFTCNIGLHHIHHVNAHIPFYRLPEVMKKFPEFQHPHTTSLSPAEIWRCLRLKLWDVEKHRMVGLA